MSLILFNYNINYNNKKNDFIIDYHILVYNLCNILKKI